MVIQKHQWPSTWRIFGSTPRRSWTHASLPLPQTTPLRWVLLAAHVWGFAPYAAFPVRV